jgi:pyruvate/2-oxoglutarate dehydrogenase complex dihydrolipoamide acyltransferase (E2) component
MRTQIVLPDVGAAPVVLSAWLADAGEEVYEGDRLVEVLVNGATFDVPAPVSGRLVEKAVYPDQPIIVGQVLGYVLANENGSE